MLGVNGYEFVLLAVLAVFLLGDRMPEYAAKFAQWIRKVRVMAEGAKGQLKEQLGPDYESVNWRQYDPRQYDPRRIVREAFLEPLDEAVAPVRQSLEDLRHPGSAQSVAEPTAVLTEAREAATTEPAVAAYRPFVQDFDPLRPVPYDRDAT